MTSENEGATGEEDRRAQARSLILGAQRARAAGDDEEAERLLDEATRVDPQATEDAIAEQPPRRSSDAPVTDEEVRLVTATVEPHSDAPSRAGITGSGSGADDM